MCSCGHTVGGHYAEPYCPGCVGGECDLDFAAWLEERLNRARAEALEQAASAWQLGEWADAPRCADRVQERLANAQHVTDWLRARAAGP